MCKLLYQCLRKSPVDRRLDDSKLLSENKVVINDVGSILLSVACWGQLLINNVIKRMRVNGLYRKVITVLLCYGNTVVLQVGSSIL
jgi:hypothetical protein